MQSECSRRWLVCASAFIVQFVLGGLANCGGVLYTALIDKFNASRGATGKTEALHIEIILLPHHFLYVFLFYYFLLLYILFACGNKNSYSASGFWGSDRLGENLANYCAKLKSRYTPGLSVRERRLLNSIQQAQNKASASLKFKCHTIHFKSEQSSIYMRSFYLVYYYLINCIFFPIVHFRIYHNTPFCPSKILHKHCFQFVLSPKMEGASVRCGALISKRRLFSRGRLLVHLWY